jgi:hypothetical protein
MQYLTTAQDSKRKKRNHEFSGKFHCSFGRTRWRQRLMYIERKTFGWKDEKEWISPSFRSFPIPRTTTAWCLQSRGFLHSPGNTGRHSERRQTRQALKMPLCVQVSVVPALNLCSQFGITKQMLVCVTSHTDYNIYSIVWYRSVKLPMIDTNRGKSKWAYTEKVL